MESKRDDSEKQTHWFNQVERFHHHGTQTVGNVCRRKLLEMFVVCFVLFSNFKENLLGQWLNFKLFWITYLVGKIKFKPFFFRVHWLSEKKWHFLCVFAILVYHEICDVLLIGFRTFRIKSPSLLFSWPILHLCHGQKSRLFGDKLIPPLMTESLFHGYIFTPTIGLIFPIPYYMEMSWELIDPIAHLDSRKNFQVILCWSTRCVLRQITSKNYSQNLLFVFRFLFKYTRGNSTYTPWN